ncbi:hypothetical protein AB0J80_28795 [Actinoplanes sp. NPDC049548]|uniref:hypothetical protein n=1 Tax=Actinoplanes sp. NPDC049548 TaxID=3155152 RepID=UPI0034429BA9
MTQYNADEARAALADIDSRTRQAVAADAPIQWPAVPLAALWLIAIGFFTDRPSAVAMPLFLGVAAVYVAGSFIVDRRRRVKSRARHWGVVRWAALVGSALLSGAVWFLTFQVLEPHTSLPHTLAGVATAVFMTVAAVVLNRRLGPRA